MANLGKKFTCFKCETKFYDFGKPEAHCPKCGANQKNAPSRPKAVKKDKTVHLIEDDFTQEAEGEPITEDTFEEGLGFQSPRAEGVDPGDLRMDDYDE
ncbi:MAG: FYDLN acid domain-containing protein [Acidobacteria bacterium]|nr:FYDLN acid domain-containing protein [Acidobacteriota bacterium]